MSGVESPGADHHGAAASPESGHRFSTPSGSELVFMLCQDSGELVEVVSALLRALCEGDFERLEIDIDPDERKRLWVRISATGSLPVLLASGAPRVRHGDPSCAPDSASASNPK